MIKKRVAELIDIERDIKPYDVIAIYAGVGSGKNTFIEGYENQMGLADNSRVLLITSRKEKVKETEKHVKRQGKHFVKYIKEEDNFSISDSDGSVACTYAYVAKYIKSNFILNNEKTYFWRQFDYIVVDEFHSLIMDSTFADGTFYLYKMLEFIYTKESGRKPKIIFMSGTPFPAEETIKTFNPHIINLFKEAIYLKPKNFQLINFEQNNAKLREFIRKGKSVVYFKNKLNDLTSFINDITQGADVFPNNEAREKSYSEYPMLSEKQYKESIAVSVSKKSVNKNIDEQYPEISKNILQWNNEHAEKEEIPSNIHLLITNAKSKEGINILSDVDYVFIESHVLCDIIQMCGRFRNIDKIKTVFLVYNATQFNYIKKYENEEEFQIEYALKKVKEYNKEIISNNTLCINPYNAYLLPDINSYINYIEGIFPFIKYNPFSNEFEQNSLLSTAINFATNSKEDYIKNFEHYKKNKRFYNDEYSSYFNDGIKVEISSLPTPFQALKNRLKFLGYDIDSYEFTGKDEKFLFEEATKLRRQFYFSDNEKYKKSLQYLLKGVFKCKKEALSKSHNSSAKFKIVPLSDDES